MKFNGTIINKIFIWKWNYWYNVSFISNKMIFNKMFDKFKEFCNYINIIKTKL